MKTFLQSIQNKLKKTNKVLLAVAATVAIAASVGLVWLVGHPIGSKPTGAQRIKIVAAENFWGNIISQLGGDKVIVTSIITDPTADPHLYESDARAATAIAQADLIITNGLGYDDFMDKLLSVSPNANRQVLTAADVLNVKGKDANPHLWYDLKRVAQVAEAFTAQLSAKDPANKPLFDKNLASFKVSLLPLLDKIQAIKTNYPRAAVAYTERVPGYLLDLAGLDVKTPLGFSSAIENANEPSVDDQTAMASLVTDHKVKVLLYNAQATSPVTQHIRDLAQEAKLPIVGVTETLPGDMPTYQQWQANQLDALLSALKNSQ
jgi:zinc/manganese transport system substrate-binding protein